MVSRETLSHFIAEFAQAAIETYLYQHKRCKESELIALISPRVKSRAEHLLAANDGIEPCFDKDPMLGLFQKHFVVRHCLYRLANTLLEHNEYRLDLGLLEISLRRVDNAQKQGTLTRASSFHALSDYYLDLDHFFEATPDSVNELLASFYRRYSANDSKEEALAALGLDSQASWPAIQLSYRQQVAAAHPDKGGDPQHFTRLREAYETLKSLYR